MKRYIVVHETNTDIVSTYTVKAENIKEAKIYAQINKPNKKCRTRVYLDK